jgi:diguanylate cyclase (GGDEF)-like protein/PAS domain S-box-containing protein
MVKDSIPLDEDFKKASQSLRGKSKLLESIMNSMGDGLSIQDKNMRIVYQNKFMLDNFGPHIGDFCYRVYENRDSICEGCPMVSAYNTRRVSRALRVGTLKNGQQFRFENIASVLKDENGQIVAGMELCRIVEDRERAFDELRAATEKLLQAKAVFENSSEGIMVVDQEDHIVSVNPAFELLTGYHAAEILGANPRILSSGRHSPEFFEGIKRSLKDTGTWQGEIWNKHKDGHIYAQSTTIDTVYGEKGDVLQRICVFTDITDKKQMEEQIVFMAQHDALTSLPNRVLFADRFQQVLSLARRNEKNFALLYIDLDRFKQVNDTLGHTAGDILLQLVASRMRKTLRESDTVARMGGDEFAVILPAMRSRTDMQKVAAKLQLALRVPFEVNHTFLDITCSIGGALYPEDGQDEETLSLKADQALYLAKEKGRDRFCSNDSGE